MRGNDAWHLTYHVFFAFFILCFFVKGLYFLVSPDAFFSLVRRPNADDVWGYALIAMAVAAFAAVIIARTYRLAYRYLSRRLATQPGTVGDRGNWLLALVGICLALLFFATRGGEIASALATGSILIRKGLNNWEEFSSGALGIKSLLLQIQGGLMFVVAAYAIVKRKKVLLLVVMVYFLANAALANGSRFTLLSSVLIVPLMIYLVYWRRPSHRRPLIALVYFSVLLLPFLAALLLMARISGTLALSPESLSAIVEPALVSFDPMDHLINYLYLLPVDWFGVRTFEQLLQVVPRALFPDKPFLYGMLALQELMYPGTVGAGSGTLLYGHYPLSNLVAGLDFALIVGLVLDAILTGWFLALLDAGFDSGEVLPVALYMMNILFMYHLIRVGAVSYLLMGAQSIFIPLFLAAVARRIGSTRLVYRPPRRSLA